VASDVIHPLFSSSLDDTARSLPHCRCHIYPFPSLPRYPDTPLLSYQFQFYWRLLQQRSASPRYLQVDTRSRTRRVAARRPSPRVPPFGSREVNDERTACGSQHGTSRTRHLFGLVSRWWVDAVAAAAATADAGAACRGSRGWLRLRDCASLSLSLSAPLNPSRTSHTRDRETTRVALRAYARCVRVAYM